jgi:hypothetical protein
MTRDGARVGGAPLSAGKWLAVGGLWFSLGALGGSTQPDARFADYQWSVSPRLAWGGQALAGRGPFATGLRLWRSGNTQTLGLSGVTDPSVHLTSLEAVGQGRLATWWGTELLGLGSVGRMHVGYDPDQLTVPSGGGPVVVDFRPVNTWIAGGGVALRRSIAEPWTVGLEVDHRVFQLDTAHRSGSTIENGRQSFHEWSARLELAWRHAIR